MLTSGQDVEGCDATKADQGTTTGHIKIKNPSKGGAWEALNQVRTFLYLVVVISVFYDRPIPAGKYYSGYPRMIPYG